MVASASGTISRKRWRRMVRNESLHFWTACPNSVTFLRLDDLKPNVVGTGKANEAKHRAIMGSGIAIGWMLISSGDYGLSSSAGPCIALARDDRGSGALAGSVLEAVPLNRPSSQTASFCRAEENVSLMP
jgi:hypothetical protein